MKLYFSPGACSMASHIVLTEAGLNFKAIKVDLKSKTAEGADYLSVNPKGYVPALQLESGMVMTEGVAIMQWAADQAPNKGLVPNWNNMERYKAIEWLNFVATEIHKGFSPLWNPAIEASAREATIARLNLRFATLDKHLATQSFVMGESFSIVDAYLFTTLSWAGFLNLDLSAYPNLAPYLERVGKRPAVQAVMKAEGLLN